MSWSPNFPRGDANSLLSLEDLDSCYYYAKILQLTANNTTTHLTETMTLLPKKFVINDQGEPLEVIISWQEYQEITEQLEKFSTLTKLTPP